MSPMHAGCKYGSISAALTLDIQQAPPIALSHLSLTAPSLLPPPDFILQVPPVPTLTPTHLSSVRYGINLRLHLLRPTMDLALAKPTHAHLLPDHSTNGGETSTFTTITFHYHPPAAPRHLLLLLPIPSHSVPPFTTSCSFSSFNFTLFNSLALYHLILT
ncbi:hypothetical protein B0H13DRAFT_2341563 [Mycena leptocephala]|nr:hypothetical protein B0H13DRAFT_2341563 [Mycena leptocephala]